MVCAILSTRIVAIRTTTEIPDTTRAITVKTATIRILTTGTHITRTDSGDTQTRVVPTLLLIPYLEAMRGKVNVLLLVCSYPSLVNTTFSLRSEPFDVLWTMTKIGAISHRLSILLLQHTCERYDSSVVIP